LVLGLAGEFILTINTRQCVQVCVQAGRDPYWEAAPFRIKSYRGLYKAGAGDTDSGREERRGEEEKCRIIQGDVFRGVGGCWLRSKYANAGGRRTENVSNNTQLKTFCQLTLFNQRRVCL
jgi:hypothetical protein